MKQDQQIRWDRVREYQKIDAAGIAAGNRSAQSAGRKHWNREDHDAAAKEFDRLASRMGPMAA
jgi:hypothetical protein